MTFDQAEYSVRCEWGLRGMSEVAGISAVVIIVDVLSFTTALDIAISRGASVFPYPLKGESAAAYAASVGASVASARSHQTFSLSPASLQGLPAGYRLVLPSPNGAGLSFNCDHPKVLGACLRNAVAVAAAAVRLGATFAVVPAGEMWPGGELRPAVEDLIGAGAVIASLPGSRSPEAQLAVASFERFRADLSRTLRECSSGKELIDRGFIGDVELAAEYNVSSAVPRLVNRAYAGGEPGV